MISTRFGAWLGDGAMCAMMGLVQKRHRLSPESRANLDRYFSEHAHATRDTYFHAPPAQPEGFSVEERRRTSIRWGSPIVTAHRENNHAHVDYFLCPDGPSRPTVIFLHALMSASDLGYRRWAADFNRRGWNAAFLHLPYHYSRRPAGRMNGELAITCDLVRNAEGLRQGVSELRQLLALLRARGCAEFGLWATSYGGWIGALVASVESGFRFLTLMAPIVDVSHAIWDSAAGRGLRPELARAGITPELVARHFPLVSPLHAFPRDPAERVLLIAGEYDQIAPPSAIEALQLAWPGARRLQVAQGHFGYRMMQSAWADLQAAAVF